MWNGSSREARRESDGPYLFLGTVILRRGVAEGEEGGTMVSSCLMSLYFKPSCFLPLRHAWSKAGAATSPGREDLGVRLALLVTPDLFRGPLCRAPSAKAVSAAPSRAVDPGTRPG